MSGWLFAATGAVVLAGTAFRLRRRYLLVAVRGASMEPALRAGERVVVRRTGMRDVRRGSVVVVRNAAALESPPRPGEVVNRAAYAPVLIKRVAAIPGDPLADVPALARVADAVVPSDRLVLLGDNALASYDSRQHGYFRAQDVLGVVVRPFGHLARRSR
ncbi:S26 family signal peptidase [Streptomyces echinatus]|uniref:S26 family signal peptidase n=1 Tax=Streptomyces echinatus TaxID=67293 RepID=UPI0037FA9999